MLRGMVEKGSRINKRKESEAPAGQSVHGFLSNMIETWKDIPEYDGKYQADTEGNIRRVYKSGKTRLMTPYKKKMSGSKRLIVKLTKAGKSKEIIVMQVISQDVFR